MRADLSACQSPLEVEFGKAIVVVLGDALEPCESRTKEGAIGWLPGWKSILGTQVNMGWCRPDFMFISVARDRFIEMGWADAARLDCVRENVVVIEIDGHEFHERTKEQARRDKSRDREMQSLGWVPLRFTGQEVYRDAIGCAQQAAEIFIERQRSTIDDAFSGYLQWLGRIKRETGECQPPDPGAK